MEGQVPTQPVRTRRDEWSESGVVCLLQAYETRWCVRNRSKLKGSDWEEIARQISFRCSGTKSPKTPKQCKNKIESMKKRYRAESASQNHHYSSWPFYSRMDGLLKGSSTYNTNPSCSFQRKNLQRRPSATDQEADDESNTLLPTVHVEEVAEKKKASDVSTRRKRLMKKRVKCEVVECIKLFGQSILKMEEMRMEMWRDMERLRVEAEIKKEELELKRTKIIADTQLQVAGLFSRMCCGTRRWRRTRRNDKSQRSSS